MDGNLIFLLSEWVLFYLTNKISANCFEQSENFVKLKFVKKQRTSRRLNELGILTNMAVDRSWKAVFSFLESSNFESEKN